MKLQTLLILFLFFAIGINAQSVIEETEEYTTYQDSIVVLKTTTITSTIFEGLNDTTVQYVPLTVGSYHTLYKNKTNTAVAKNRRARDFRLILANYVATKGLMDSLGQSLDSLNVKDYGSNFIGRWRVFDDNNNTFFVDVDYHPANADLLRATGTDGEGNFNILVYGESFFRIAIAPGELRYLDFDEIVNDRPIYRNPVWRSIPQQLATSSSFRMIKLTN